MKSNSSLSLSNDITMIGLGFHDVLEVYIFESFGELLLLLRFTCFIFALSKCPFPHELRSKRCKFSPPLPPSMQINPRPFLANIFNTTIILKRCYSMKNVKKITYRKFFSFTLLLYYIYAQ